MTDELARNLQIQAKLYCDSQLQQLENLIKDFVHIKVQAPLDARVDSLRTDFTGLKTEFKSLKQNFVIASKEVEEVKSLIKTTERELSE